MGSKPSPSRVLPRASAFDDAPFWDGASLEAALLRESGRLLRLTLTDNRSVLLSFRRRGNEIDLRLHRMFLHAPIDVVRGVAQTLRRQRPAGEGGVRRFMNENLHRVRQTPRLAPPIQPQGRVYNLGEVYEDLNQRFFDARLRVPITWGRGVGRARHAGITFGSYDPVLSLIRIHPVLDRTNVPRYFLESVVYHEMLHHQLGGEPDKAGRTIYHSRAFREAEARYPRHDEALTWEKENLRHLLRAVRTMDRRQNGAATGKRRGVRRP
jgi:hypothetical protein